jgi:anti-sigma factor RsiW
MNQMEMEYLISRFADNTLSEPERKKARQLIKSNPQCRRWLANHRQMQEVLDDWSSRLPMLDWKSFDAAVASRIDRRIRAGETHLLWARRWLGAAAVAGMLALIGGTFWLTHLPARRDVPSFIQHTRSFATGNEIPADSVRAVSMQRVHPGKPAVLVRPTVKPTLHKLPKPSVVVASDAVKPKPSRSSSGYGIAPDTGSSHPLQGVADVPLNSSNATSLPR